jgi:hypothetical protein
LLSLIGFVATLSIFTNQPQSEVTNGTPESHQWKATEITPNDATYIYNTVTGEVYYLKAGTKKVAKD